MNNLFLITPSSLSAELLEVNIYPSVKVVDLYSFKYEAGMILVDMQPISEPII